LNAVKKSNIIRSFFYSIYFITRWRYWDKTCCFLVDYFQTETARAGVKQSIPITAT